MGQTRQTFIVAPLADKPALTQLAVYLGDNPANTDTFTVPICTEGSPAVTHYACCIALSPEKEAAVYSQKPNFPNVLIDTFIQEEQPDFTAQFLAEHGLYRQDRDTSL